MQQNKGEVDYLVIADYTKLSRNFVRLPDLQKQLRESGVEIKTVKKNQSRFTDDDTTRKCQFTF